MSQSAKRTLLLLQAVAKSGVPLGLIELTKLTELDKSTAARLLGELEGLEFLVRDPMTRKFTVGPVLRSLAATTLLSSPVTKLVRPYLEQLRDESGETAFLHMRVRYERVCLDSVESSAEIRQVSAVGEVQPLYAVPSGKVMLAHMSAADIEALLSRAADEGYDAATIAEQLAFTQKHGYLSVDQDKTPDVSILSVPLFDTLGANYSLTVAGPRTRWGNSAMRRFVPQLVTISHTLSSALGSSAPMQNLSVLL